MQSLGCGGLVFSSVTIRSPTSQVSNSGIRALFTGSACHAGCSASGDGAAAGRTACTLKDAFVSSVTHGGGDDLRIILMSPFYTKPHGGGSSRSVPGGAGTTVELHYPLGRYEDVVGTWTVSVGGKRHLQAHWGWEVQQVVF